MIITLATNETERSFLGATDQTFIGHRAIIGCSKRLNSFPTAVLGDYLNFNRRSWEPRSNCFHRDVAGKYQLCNSRAEQYGIECAYGVRYSVLLNLLYFDAARVCVCSGNCKAHG